MKIEKCSCTEVQHLRRALKTIRKILSIDTGRPIIDDLAQCNTLADQALKLQGLTGDPGVYDVSKYVPKA